MTRGEWGPTVLKQENRHRILLVYRFGDTWSGYVIALHGDRKISAFVLDEAIGEYDTISEAKAAVEQRYIRMPGAGLFPVNPYAQRCFN